MIQYASALHQFFFKDSVIRLAGYLFVISNKHTLKFVYNIQIFAAPRA